MKTLAKFLTIVLALIIFAGCNKDDPRPKSTSKLVGKWTVASTQTLLSVNGMSYKEFLMVVGGLSEEDAGIFNEIVESMLTLTGFDGEVEFKDNYTWVGDSEFVSTPTSGTWDLTSDEKTLTMTNDAQAGVTQSATITKLNDTDFWFELAPADLKVQGAPPGAQYTGVVKLTRKK